LNAGGKYRSIFCYEEAIGFCCGDVIFDKDGISALGVFAELTYSAYRQGSSLTQQLQSLYDKYGEFVSHNGYYFFQPDNDGSIVSKIFGDIRQGGAYRTTVGPYPIESIRDLGEPGYDSTDARPGADVAHLSIITDAHHHIHQWVCGPVSREWHGTQIQVLHGNEGNPRCCARFGPEGIDGNVSRAVGRTLETP
jgi:hypothetical protein